MACGYCRGYIIRFAIPCLIFFHSLFAYDDRPACYKALSRDFFTFQLTQRALSLYMIPQPQWDRIWREIKKRSDEQALAILQEKARARTPSPFEAPFQRDLAEKILHETMYEIFYRVVVEYGFYDPTSIRNMFEYIWDHDPRIPRCFPPVKK